MSSICTTTSISTTTSTVSTLLFCSLLTGHVQLRNVPSISSSLVSCDSLSSSDEKFMLNEKYNQEIPDDISLISIEEQFTEGLNYANFESNYAKFLNVSLTEILTK